MCQTEYRFNFILLLLFKMWPRGLRRRCAAARLLRSRVRILPGTWMFVCCECCVLSGRSLCDELIARPEETYRLWCVVVCDLETSRMGAPYIYDISHLRVNGSSFPHSIDSHDFFCAVALRPNAGHGLLILEVSRSHTTTHHSR